MHLTKEAFSIMVGLKKKSSGTDLHSPAAVKAKEADGDANRSAIVTAHRIIE